MGELLDSQGKRGVIVVLPFHGGDILQAERLLQWIDDLGGCKEFDCLLVSDAGVPCQQVLGLQELAGQCFRQVEIVTNDKPTAGWIQGANSLFWTAAETCEQLKTSWLWLEPDAVPLRAGWLKAIADEYASTNRRFLGELYLNRNRMLETQAMSGIAVYPPDAYTLLAQWRDTQIAFDMAIGPTMRMLAQHTDLIQHCYGPSRDKHPSFVEARKPTDPPHVTTISSIRPEAVLFHTNKDGTLIELLREKLIPERRKMLVVWPFCNRDGALALKNLQWIGELNPKYRFDILLSWDVATQKHHVEPMRAAAVKCFRKVHEMVYPCAEKGWLPHSNAFKQAAWHVRDRFKCPFLWMEYDAIPLVPDWLDRLWSAYRSCGKPFCGPIVPGMGHMNGTGIYPNDACDRIPKALAVVHDAWDVVMKREMIHDCADLIPLYQHVWGIERGRPMPFSGSPVSFSDPNMLRIIDPRAVIFHRSKDGTLIDRLRERKHA